MSRESFAEFYLSALKKAAEERTGNERDRILKKIRRNPEVVSQCVRLFEERHGTTLTEREKAIFADAFYYGKFDSQYEEEFLKHGEY